MPAPPQRDSDKPAQRQRRAALGRLLSRRRSSAVPHLPTRERNFETLRNQLPIIDRALYALLNDLETRGLAQAVTVIMGGEMGRTPRISRDRAGGREHWPVTGITVMAGGGLRPGQVVGASDARGEQVRSRPITPQMMMATLYRTLGIDTAQTFPSNSGRPMYLLDERAPIHELF